MHWNRTKRKLHQKSRNWNVDGEEEKWRGEDEEEKGRGEDEEPIKFVLVGLNVFFFFKNRTHRKLDLKTCQMKQNLDYNNTFPIDLVSNGIPFSLKSSVKV